MDSSAEVSANIRNSDMVNLIQVKQEADEEPHIIYDDNEQWAFLFSDAVNEMKTNTDNKQDGVLEHGTESFTIETEVNTCHWCSFFTEDPLDLIDHDFENHSRFYQGKRIYKSYKCPSCDYTSIDPSNIRNHFEIHRNWPDAADHNNDIAAVNMQIKKKKKRKQSWHAQAKKKREQRRLQNNGDQKNEALPQKRSKMTPEERRLKKILHSRNYRASLTQEALARRRLNDAARMRLKRALESTEARAERQRKQALRARQKRASETPEEVELRRTKQRNRARVRRSLETEEQRELRKERERLRARERRASLSVEKKEFIRNVERTRKRYTDQTEFVDVHHLMHAAEFLTTSLSSPSENSYQQSSNVVLDIKPSNSLSDEASKFCPESLFELADPTFPNSEKAKADSNVKKRIYGTSNAKYRSKNKKRGRPKSNKNKGNALENTSNVTCISNVEESSPNDPLALNFRGGYLQDQNIDFNNATSSKKFNCMKNSETFHCEISPSIEIVNELKLNEIFSKRQFVESNEHGVDRFHITKEKSFEMANSRLLTPLVSTKINEIISPNVMQGDFDLFNNMKHSQSTKVDKMDKINKLLHRMCERDSK